jgi:CheY-like chemotaxis protein
MKKRGKVLVVEDNPRWSERLRRILEENGFHVTTIQTKEEALALLGNEHFHFATIDLQLDEENLDSDNFEGWTVLKKILAVGASNRMDIMVLTGFEADENREKAFHEYGGRPILFMPKSKFDKKEFIDTIIRVVDMRKIRFKDDHKD